jgi:catechol 2,3-dioxygenase-like lactoylglutathione lyase family enzyme
MIGYVTFGTNDMARACAFYDALFGEIGIPRLMEFPNGVCWGPAMDKPALGVLLPFNKEPATAGNGSMVALACPDTATVNRLHAKALQLGAANEGDPGPRGPGFYGAYFRDLDGNKLNGFCMTAG